MIFPFYSTTPTAGLSIGLKRCFLSVQICVHFLYNVHSVYKYQYKSHKPYALCGKACGCVGYSHQRISITASPARGADPVGGGSGILRCRRWGGAGGSDCTSRCAYRRFCRPAYRRSDCRPASGSRCALRPAGWQSRRRKSRAVAYWRPGTRR